VSLSLSWCLSRSLSPSLSLSPSQSESLSLPLYCHHSPPAPSARCHCTVHSPLQGRPLATALSTRPLYHPLARVLSAHLLHCPLTATSYARYRSVHWPPCCPRTAGPPNHPSPSGATPDQPVTAASEHPSPITAASNHPSLITAASKYLSPIATTPAICLTVTSYQKPKKTIFGEYQPHSTCPLSAHHHQLPVQPPYCPTLSVATPVSHGP
jgi:hypothetical protein